MDLVISDVVMPEMGGRELGRRLAALRPSLPVLFMSGYTGEDVIQRGLMEPGAPFQQKPFTPEGLARKVREMLDAARARRRPAPPRRWSRPRRAGCPSAPGRNSRWSARRIRNPRGVESRVSRSPAMLTIRCVTPGKIGATSYQTDGAEIGILPLMLGPEPCLDTSHLLSLPAWTPPIYTARGAPWHAPRWTFRRQLV